MGTTVFWMLPLLLVMPVEVRESSDFHLAGDYLLGGLFTLHANIKGIAHLNYMQVPRCKDYDVKVLGYNLMQAMRFAVEEINNDSRLLPGVSLGYEMVDVCYVTNNIQPVLYFLAKENFNLPIQQDYSSYEPRVVAVIGPDTSESVVTVSNFLSLFLLPQITYSAVSDEFRDNSRFPALFRTIPSGEHQIKAMIQLITYFHWNWVIVIASSDDYGRENSQLFNEKLKGEKICVAFQESLPVPLGNKTLMPAEKRRLEAIVDKIQNSSAKVVVVLSLDLALYDFFEEAISQNVTGYVWIASESWSIDPVIHGISRIQQIGTFLGISTQNIPIPGFSDFRVRQTPTGRPETDKKHSGPTCNQECDTCPDTLKSYNAILTHSGDRVAYNVYSAVYTVAHALHRLLGCNAIGCAKDTVYPWKLLQEIRKVNFTLLGHRIYFDKNGDPPMGLEIIQWQWDTGHDPFKRIAFYNPAQQYLSNVATNISWNTPNNSAPFSVCSNSCQLGQRKKPMGLHICCFECINCPAGTYLNQSGDFECQPCPPHEWSNEGEAHCFRRRLRFLEWREPATLAVALLAGLGFLGTLGALGVFCADCWTPVSALRRGPASCLRRHVLLVAYGAVPVYVGRPSVPACLCRQVLFNLCFTLCMACITVRSFQIVCVFKMARRLPRAYSCWLRYRGPYASAGLLTLLKAAVVAAHVLLTPAGLTVRHDPDDARAMTLNCNGHYGRALLLNTGLDLALCVLAFGFAYLGRELPTSYSEAKFITLSVTFYFVSSVFLCTFVSVYQGVLVTIFDMAVTVVNLLGISVGYFGPKCYLILFCPERNTAAYFNGVIQGYTMRKE
ncbi:LOW QUALITY PROTEIN: taste receptor type 1 member 2 [Sarcophilus harrisii]|uniref:LOW QUALITY PROTEIN: taste receptor type 1 member 2 n=1 Tax=Sarcophilus harrisii TaxID=9305 RepID=UPI0013020C29|nr:LOW QUALITY PROTEIN: taste receptor type 1 member 2 [Sarcophilus harrisii]